MSAAIALKPKPENLVIDRRDPERAVEVTIAFSLIENGRVHRGLRLSRRHLIVVEDELSQDLLLAETASAEICVRLDGFDLMMPVRISASDAARSQPGTLSFQMIEMDARTETTLGQLIRTSLTGWLPQADDLARGWDDETPMPAAKPAAAPQKKPVHWLLLSAGIVLLALGIAAAGYQAFLIFTTIPADAAAVTAARYDIVSSEYGVVADGAVVAGSTVTAGQALLTVKSADLDAELAAQEADPHLVGPLPIQTDSPFATDAPKMVLGTEAARAVGQLAALQRRVAALSFKAHCTCTVLWAATPGISVAPGALLMTLVVSDPRKIRVEALVGARAALAVHAGQGASITVSGDATPHHATVESVRYDSSPVPQIGLGTDRGTKATVVLKLDDPAVALVPGTPASVVISK